MSERLTIINYKDSELRKHLERIPWRDFIDFGSIKIQVQNGQLVLITIEKTVKIDQKV